MTIFLIRFTLVTLILPSLAFATPTRRSPPRLSWEQKYMLAQQASKRAKVGDAHLFQLEPEAAIAVYERVLRDPHTAVGVGGYTVVARASWGLARAYAEKGGYARALQWLNTYTTRYPSRCGNCIESRLAELHAIRVVWKAAMLPVQEAEPGLRRIIAGDFHPLPSRLNRGSEAGQKAFARREASLVLAETFLKQGKPDEARELLRSVVRGPNGGYRDEVTRLAVAHLSASK